MTTFSATIHDRALATQVSEELDWAPNLDASHVSVTADRGVVALSGSVPTRADQVAAMNAAFRVRGVLTVADDITVTDVAIESDVEIARAVDHSLLWDPMVPTNTVHAEVRDHTVVLSGTVPWNYQRQAATDAVRFIPGVASVDTRITLTERVSAPDTELLIKNALIRHATIDADTIGVTAEGTAVTLTGTTSSQAEKVAAADAAWSSPHVTAVHNNITLEARH